MLKALSRPVDKLWWFRFCLAMLTAILSAFLGLIGVIGPSTAVRALLIAIVVYILSYYVARFVWRITPDQLPKRRDMLIAGLLPFFIVWLAFWVFFHTIFTVLL
ncbi:MAG: hypothetical protein ABIH76_04965 [Candidatus Bathyarchaeota archaeon]